MFNFLHFKKNAQKQEPINFQKDNDRKWAELQERYLKAFSKQRFSAIYYIENERAWLLFSEKKYKGALQFFLRAMFIDVQVSSWHIKKGFYKISTFINLLGDCARCIAYLDLTKEQFKDIVLGIPVEKGVDFTFSVKELLPYYLKAFDRYSEEKKKHEKKYKTRYLIGEKIQ